MTTILLVEDDALQASLLLSLLRHRFNEVRRVSDASDALCLIEEPEFASKLSLVISGHQTLGIGAPAFVAELHTRMPGLPILVLGSPGEVPDDYAMEMVSFLPRIYAAEEMLALTNRILSRYRHVAA